MIALSQDWTMLLVSIGAVWGVIGSLIAFVLLTTDQ